MPALSSSLSIDDPGKSPHWALIIYWPGLDEIHTVKITRSLDARTLTQQFHNHVLRCPNVLDNVMYSLKNHRMGYDEDYNLFFEQL
jgi:hypothetical protein